MARTKMANNKTLSLPKGTPKVADNVKQAAEAKKAKAVKSTAEAAVATTTKTKTKSAAAAPPAATPAKEKKAEVHATPLNECLGSRDGSYRKLLSFSSCNMFGREAGVRLTEDYKQFIKFTVERIMIHITRDAKMRRAENKCGSRLMGWNFDGAFLAWASVVDPALKREYKTLHLLSDTETPATSNAYAKHSSETEFAKNEAYQILVRKNIAAARKSNDWKITDTGKLAGDELSIFKHYCKRQMRSLEAEEAKPATKSSSSSSSSSSSKKANKAAAAAAVEEDKDTIEVTTEVPEDGSFDTMV